MRILTGKEIHQLAGSGQIFRANFNQHNFETMFYSLTLGRQVQSVTKRDQSFRELDGPLVLSPGEVMNVEIHERFNFNDSEGRPRFGGLIVSRARLLAGGISHPPTAVDPGATRATYLTLINHTKFPGPRMFPGTEKIAKMIVFDFGLENIPDAWEPTMNGTETGRVDGGIGVMLESPAIVVRARPAVADSIILSESNAASSREELSSGIAALVARVRASLKIGPMQIEVLSCPAAHTGLGAKTQVMLAAAVAAIRSYDHVVDLGDLAEFTGRGGTSGIGFHGFQLGGFIVDAGHPIATKGGELIYRPSSRSQSAGTPPLLARYEFPWPVLIVTPPGHRIHGEWEARLFKEVCPIPTDDVRSVCQTILMRILPAIVENDLATFGAGLWEIQSRRWKAFEIQSQAPGVGRLMSRLRDELHVDGAGMSSWGTSIMCVDSRLSDTRCEDFVEEVRRIMVVETGEGQLVLTRGRNAPATICVI